MGTATPAIVVIRTVALGSTEVDFDEAVRFGDSPTAAQHAEHWTVMEGSNGRAVDGAEVVRGGLTVRLSHAELSGAASMPTVAYARDADDAARVRDWATAPNLLADAPAEAAADGLPPRVTDLAVTVSRPGEADAPARTYARAGDTVTVTATLSEGAGTTDPTILIGERSFGMTSPGIARLSWTHAYAVPATDAAQGEFAFLVSAADVGGNPVRAAHPTSGGAFIDTVLPTFTARTLGDGAVGVTFAEPVSGTVEASEWTVMGAAATGVADSTDGPFGDSLELESATAFVLEHKSRTDTGGTPAVVYSPRATS